MNTNTVILTIARMNPPTPGHKDVMKRMLNEAYKSKLEDKDKNVQIQIILSHSTGDKKNPIICPDKKKLVTNYVIPKIQQEMENEWSKTDIPIQVHCMDDFPIPEGSKASILANAVRNILPKSDFFTKTEIVLVIGQDRENSYDWLFTTLLTNPNNSLRIISLDRVGNPISATEMRELTIREDKRLTMPENNKKNLQEFNLKMEPTGIPIADLEILFLQIQKEMQRESPVIARKSKKTDTSKSKSTSTKRIKEEPKTTTSRKRKGGKSRKTRLYR